MLYRFTVGVLLFCAFAYAAFNVGSMIQREAEKSLTGYQRAISRPEAIRKEYGAFGRKYASRETSTGVPPSAAEQSLMELPDKYKNIETYQSQATGFSSVPQNPASPFGPRGNNYSVYDIHSPGGVLGKF